MSPKYLSILLASASLLSLASVPAQSDGRIAFWSVRNGQREIYTMDSNGGNLQQVTNTPGLDESYPAWRKDGKKLAYPLNNGIQICNPDGSGTVFLAGAGGLDMHENWSPDGSKLLFSANGGQDADIFTMNADGSNVTKIISNPYGDYSGGFSPDGTKICFYTSPHGLSDQAVYVANADGSGQVALTDTGVSNKNNDYPRWSPDGEKIVFRSNRDGNDEIYVMNADGTQPVRLTNNAAKDWLPNFSPDGKQVTWVSERDGNPEIYIMNADGSSPTRLTNNVGEDSEPAWAFVPPAGAPALSVNNVTVNEGDLGTTTATFTFSLSAPAATPVSFWVKTADGTATAPNDYSPVSATQVTIAPGDTSATVTVGINGDSVNEPDETFALKIFGVPNATCSQFAATGTITDPVDPLPTVSIGSAKVREGNSGPSAVNFPLTLSAPSGYPVTVTAVTTGGTGTNPATSGTDFSAVTNGTVTFLPGTTSALFSVAVAGDISVEPDETFGAAISAPLHAILGNSAVTGTILNDDQPLLTVTSSGVSEGDGGTRTATFTISLSQAHTVDVTFDYFTSDMTAKAGTDYVAASGSATIPAGQMSTTVVATVTGDTLPEANETFALNLANIVNGVGPLSSRPLYRFGHYYEIYGTSTTWNAAQAEAASRYVAGAPGHLVTINSATEQSFLNSYFAVSNYYIGGLQPAGSAEPAGGWGWITGEPFTYTNWYAGEPNDSGNDNSLILNTAGQWADVNSANSYVSLFEYDVSPSVPFVQVTGTATIQNDDALPTLSVVGSTANETAGATSTATVTVNLSGISGQTITVNYGTSSGLAIAGLDFTPTNGTLTFAPGETSKTFTVPILDDVKQEPTEPFNVVLSGAVNATIATASAQVNILDDDYPTVTAPTITVSDITVPEGDASNSPATFTFTLSNPIGLPVTVQYRTLNNTAKAGTDYVALPPTTLTFAPNETSKTVVVQVIGNTIDEADKTFYLLLSTPTNSVLARSAALGTISDPNDPAPTVSVGDASVTEGDSGTKNLSFPITLSGPSGYPVTVSAATSAATSGNIATSGSDFTATSGTVSFAAGATTATFNVPLLGDATVERNEAFNVSLTSPTHALLGRSVAVGTILNDDLPVLVANDPKVAEGNAGTHVATVKFTLSQTSFSAVTFDYATVDGTAVAGVDYTAATGSVTIAAGNTTASVPVTIIGNTLYEADKTFTLKVTNLQNALLPTTSSPARNSVNGHYYELINDPVNWPTAKAAAEARTYLGLQGHLATLTSASEVAFINSNFIGGFFLGGYQTPGSAEPAGGWAWITGEPWVYTNWYAGEPNNANGNEEYLAMNAGANWNDLALRDNNNYLIEYDVPTDNGGTGLVTILNDDAAPAPANTSLTPATANDSVGATRSFSAVYTHPGGATSITTARLLINGSLTAANGLVGSYDRAANKLYLYNNAGTAQIGGFAPGSANTISNSQGSLNCAATTVSLSGTTLTINWNFTAASGFAGGKNLYMLVTSNPGGTAGWDQKGTWALGNVAPTNTSVTPATAASAANTAQQLSAVYADYNGATDIRSARILINSSLSGAQGLVGYYDRAANKLYLYNDAGTTLQGGFAPGSANVITNGQGSLNCAATTVSQAGTNLTVNWNFTPSFSGVKKVYLLVADSTNLQAGWDQKGTWTIGGGNAAPVNSSVSPNAGSSVAGTAQTVSTVHTDANGVGDIKSARILINGSLSSTNGLIAAYDRLANKLYLYNDAGTVQLGGFAPGSANVITNSQGSLDCAATTVVQSGTTLTINWRFTPAAGFVGSKKLYLLVTDNSNVSAGWDQKGTWTIGASGPRPAPATSTTDPSGGSN